MKKYAKTLCLFLACLFVLPILPSCRKKGDTIYYLNFKPEIASVYEEIAKAYKDETGVTLRVVTAASGTYEQTLKSELGKSSAPTIFQINGPIGYASWKNYCKDLKGTKLYAHLTDKSLAVTDGDGVYGIPYVVEGYGIIYNKAITDKYFALTNRATSIKSMDEVRSFATLKALVEDMTAHKTELGISGVFASTSLKSGEDWRWTTHLANLPLAYEFQNNNVDLSSSSATDEIEFKYADNFKELFDLYINNSTTDPKLLGSKQVSDSMSEFALGQCAMVQNGNWAWAQISGISGNKVLAENIKMLPLYTGIEGESEQGICIGTENFFAINSRASEEEQKLAEDFLYWLYSSETGKRFVTEKLDFIAPFDTFADADRPRDPLSAEVYFWMEKEGVRNVPWNFTVFPGQSFKTDFGSALLQYAQGSKSWDDVKNIFVTRWKEESR